MIKVGVVGLGMMGTTHLDVYSKHPGVEVFAVADIDPDVLRGRKTAAGNVKGQAAGGFDLAKVRQYDEGLKLIADPDVDLVDICLWTPLHVKYAKAALAAGKHVLCEKPMCRTAREAAALAAAAATAKGYYMTAMCMRFWPGWDWLKTAIAKRTYGKCLAAHFRRVTSPIRKPFYLDGKRCGGAILDLHIHDTDFVQYCFGVPEAVYSRGYSRPTSEPDHVLTHYLYPDVPLVTAEGGWAYADGFGFKMQFTVNFERATAAFDFDGKNNVTLTRPGQPAEKVEVGDTMGYQHEIAYLIECIQKRRRPAIVTPADGVNTMRIVEAERKSVRTGRVVKLG